MKTRFDNGVKGAWLDKDEFVWKSANEKRNLTFLVAFMPGNDNILRKHEQRACLW